MTRNLVVGVVLMVVAAIPAVAQDRPIVDKGQAVVAQSLGLDAGQVSKWDELLATRETVVKGFAEQVKGLEESLKTELAKVTPDAVVVGNLVIEIKGLRGQIGVAEKAYLDGFETMLTTEQAAKLVAVRRAARVEPLLPAFRLLGLIPPPASLPPTSPN
jgi:hypothetical protein